MNIAFLDAAAASQTNLKTGAPRSSRFKSSNFCPVSYCWLLGKKGNYTGYYVGIVFLYSLPTASGALRLSFVLNFKLEDSRFCKYTSAMTDRYHHVFRLHGRHTSSYLEPHSVSTRKYPTKKST